jgi:protein-tyrosine kinase
MGKGPGMSKIIDALEKAKREGTLAQPGGAAWEAPARARHWGPEGAAREAVKRRAGRSSYVGDIPLITPEALKDVDDKVETLHSPLSAVSEQYRALRNRIERLHASAGVRTIAITSALKGEGKSVTTANLAVVLAQNANQRVLVVDTDFRRPHLHELLGLPLSPGLSEHLLQGAPREQVFRRLPFSDLTVVTAGNASGHPGELVASPAFADFLSGVRSEFDFVLLDTSPVQPVSDVAFLTEVVDGLVLVIRANRTPKELVKRAADSFPAGKLIGAVLNWIAELDEGYTYGKSYYSYHRD